MRARISAPLLGIFFLDQLCHGTGNFDYWIWRNPLHAGSPITALAFGNGLFAAGTAGGVVTSADGVYWTEHNSGTSANLREIAYHDGTFGACTLGEVCTSSDATSWSPQTIGTNFTESLACVASGGGLFVIGANGGGERVYQEVCCKRRERTAPLQPPGRATWSPRGYVKADAPRKWRRFIWQPP
jgi:hypothetical protein